MIGLKERVEYIILGVAATIFTLYHAILTHLVISENRDEALSFLFVLGVEAAAFVPLGIGMYFLMRISRSDPYFFTTFSGVNIFKHIVLALGVFTIHAVWQQFVNSYFFESKFTFTMVVHDFVVFSKMRFMVYVTVVGLFAGLLKLRKRQQMQLKNAALSLELQKAKMREIELKMNPEIIYPNLNFIKTKTIDKPEEASQMVILMAGFLRKLVDTIDEEKLKLSDEISLFKLYTDVCRLKLQRYIDVTATYDPKYAHTKVPSFLLLVPIIEELLFGAYKQLAHDFSGFGLLAKFDSDNQIQIQIQCNGLSKAKECASMLKKDVHLIESQQMMNELEYDEHYELVAAAKKQTLILSITVTKQNVDYV